MSAHLVTPTRPGRKGRRQATSVWTPGTILAVVIMGVALLAALLPGLLTSRDPISGSFVPLQAPSWEHWFGTDSVGRDLYSRVIYGARQSLSAAILAVAIGLVGGTILGVIAGTQRRPHPWIDAVIMRIVDVLLSIPALLLSLSIIIVLGFGTLNAAFAVGITSIATFARLSRSQVISVVESDFVEAAYGSGATAWKVLTRHIIPNSLTPVLALAAVQFGSAILQLATLGFLGYGTPPPIPEWGLLIADGRDYVATSWWLTVLPGVVIVAVVMSTNHLATALRKGQ
ncbi:ABC-type transporter, permease component [Corynebacterium renale]|uniref:ABC transporter permease n=1 Tax=Corynebacterium renale TaxID=1724 RepID=UPI000DA41B69|nr:ABC transporter permease [Corynebacterium renale]SQG65236.1 ABC-type transporter, permease component [Corynebacterium renale]STC98442.1 ABC-type transporter, permease component [Corynebacterium renale]